MSIQRKSQTKILNIRFSCKNLLLCVSTTIPTNGLRFVSQYSHLKNDPREHGWEWE